MFATLAFILGVTASQAPVQLIPVAYILGTSFKPAARKPLASILHWDRW